MKNKIVLSDSFKLGVLGDKTILYILDNVSEGIFIHNKDMEILFFNAAASQITGFSPQEALGKRCTDIFGGKFCRTQCALNRGFKGKREDKSLEIRITKNDGSYALITINSLLLKNANGDPWAACILFKDITELDYLKKELKERYSFHNIIGKSKQMQEIYGLIEDIADSDLTTLLTGESGTGKELVANAIHYQSPRSNGPFVKVQCSLLSENILESELFGHVMGAFTGALRDRIGRFELAHNGTIFLDEIGDISPQVQLKLLRVLQDKEVERVGDAKTIKVDVRIIAATNKNLKDLVKEGKFREDLFYRLYVVPIEIPPLRERKDDITLLVFHFLEMLRKRTGKEIKGISPKAMDYLMEYQWPGNVRELEHVLEFSSVRCRNREILPEHLPTEIVKGAPLVSSFMDKNKRIKIDIDLLSKAIEDAKGNKTKAAQSLGVGRTTIWRRLKDFQE